MERSEVYKLIDGECTTIDARKRHLEDWLTDIEDELLAALEFAADGFPAEAEGKLLAVAALAVAALEQHGCPPRTTE